MLMRIPDKPEQIDYGAMVEAMRSMGLVTDITPLENIESVRFTAGFVRVVYMIPRGAEIVRIHREIPIGWPAKEVPDAG